MEAVRHFLGFADDSDARVVKNCVLAQIGYGLRVAAEDDCRRVEAASRVLGFAKHAVTRVEWTASGAACYRCVAAEDECPQDAVVAPMNLGNGREQGALMPESGR